MTRAALALAALAAGSGWLLERRARLDAQRSRNNAIAEAARLRDQLAAARRGSPSDYAATLRAQARLGLFVQDPSSHLRVVDPGV